MVYKSNISRDHIRIYCNIKKDTDSLHHCEVSKQNWTLKFSNDKWKKDEPKLLWKETLNIKQISSFQKAIDEMQTRHHPFNYAVMQEKCNSMVTKITPTLLAFS